MSFKSVLKEYCMVENMKDAEKFARVNFNVSQHKVDVFLATVETCLLWDIEPFPKKDDEYIKDYIDSLRRNYYD